MLGIENEVVSLRTEIIESEKARIGLLKYKLVVVASLAAIGLGFSERNANTKIASDYILCIIPFACAYVDLLCYHNTIRTLVIAYFLKHHDDPYENYICQLGDALCTKSTGYFFNMEDTALFLSSVTLSILLVIYSIVPFFSEYDHVKGSIFWFAGLIAIIANYLTKLSFNQHVITLSLTSTKVEKYVGSPSSLTTTQQPIE
jgi:hypothetical protein